MRDSMFRKGLVLAVIVLFIGASCLASGLSNKTQMTMNEGPVLQIGKISGGLRVKTEIKNNGDQDAVDVEWNISAFVLHLIPLRVERGIIKEGKIKTLEEGQNVSVSLRLTGLAIATITVMADASNANAVQKDAFGIVLLLYVIIVKQ